MADDLEVKIGADTGPLDKVTSSADRLGDELAKEAQIIDQVDKAAVKLAKDLERLDTLHKQGKLSAEQHAAASTAVRQSFVQQSQAIEKQVTQGQRFVSNAAQMQGKLNLMRQGADVFTTAAMGMNPAMIAIQQGPQIIDAMLTSGIRLSPVMIALGAAIGVTAGAVLALGAGWLKGEADAIGYERAVSGVGRTANLTADELHALVEVSAEAGDVSESSARQQAEAYLATGRVGGEVLDDLIRIGKDYASFMGVDAATATKHLAKAMEDPDKAGREMTRTFGLLTQEQLKQIDAAMKAGDQMRAQTILLDALDKAVSGHAEQVGEITNAWDAVTTSISNAITKFGEWMYVTDTERLAKLNEGIAAAQRNEARGIRSRPGYIEGLVERRNALENEGIARRNRQRIAAAEGAANQAAQLRADNADPVRKTRGPSAETLANRARRAAEDQLRDELAALEVRKQAADEDFGEQMRLQDEKLTRLRGFYGEDAREYQSALQEKARMQRSHDQQVAASAQQAIQTRARIEEGALEAATEAEKIALEAQLELLDQRQAAGELNAVQALLQRQELNRRLMDLDRQRATAEYQIARKGLTDQLALDNLTVQQREALNRQIETLDAQHQQRMTVMTAQANAQRQTDDAQAAQAVQSRWQAIVNPIGSSLSSGFTQWAAGLTTFEQAWASFGQTLLGMIDQWVAEMVTKWLAKEAAETAATVAGVTTRTAAETAGATVSEGISAASAAIKIGHRAAEAAAGAYAALAGIPVIGPVLAPAAAVAALAAVLALGKQLFSARGGVGSVANDGDLYELHREEMVLPANIARPLRSALADGAGPGFTGGDTPGAQRQAIQPNFNIYAMDGQSVRRTLKRHGRAIVDSLQNQVRDFNEGTT